METEKILLERFQFYLNNGEEIEEKVKVNNNELLIKLKKDLCDEFYKDFKFLLRKESHIDIFIKNHENNRNKEVLKLMRKKKYLKITLKEYGQVGVDIYNCTN